MRSEIGVFVGRLDFENDLGVGPQLARVSDQAGPRVAVLVVGK